MLDITKINFTYKKLFGTQFSSNSKEFYEEQPGLLIYQHANNVWIDEIDPTPPDSSTPIIKKYESLELVEDKTVQNRKSFYAVNSNGERIRGFIPPSYGIDYLINLQINNTKIPSSHSSHWIFDYVNGVLTFESTPPEGTIKISGYQYVGKTFSQYLDNENNTVARGIMGIETPQTEYLIQHNMNTFDIETIIYTFDEVNGTNFWKKDIIPLILLDENKVKIQLSEALPIRFIIKSYNSPEI